VKFSDVVQLAKARSQDPLADGPNAMLLWITW
jgi:hypothetical protein